LFVFTVWTVAYIYMSLLHCRDLKPENILLDDNGELIRSCASCLNLTFSNY